MTALSINDNPRHGHYQPVSIIPNQLDAGRGRGLAGPGFPAGQIGARQCPVPQADGHLEPAGGQDRGRYGAAGEDYAAPAPGPDLPGH
jgi:hypothetical protein